MSARLPRSAGGFRAWFRTEQTAWIIWLGALAGRSPARHAGTRGAGSWVMRYECAGCDGRTSVTASEIFDRRRTPLTVWFGACWLFATQKDGISAQSLQRSLEIGSYRTAWAMLHRLGRCWAPPGSLGTVEVDETFIGGQEPGLRGGRAKARRCSPASRSRPAPRGIGRCRMAVLADASAESLNPFIPAHRAGQHRITDAWQGYSGLAGLGYTRERRSQRARAAAKIRRAAAERAPCVSLASDGAGHPPGLGGRGPPARYLNEFVRSTGAAHAAAAGLTGCWS